MFTAQLLILIILSVVAIGLIVFFKCFKKCNFSDRFFKVLSYVALVLFVVWYMGGHEAAESVIELIDGAVSSKVATAFSLIAIWLMYMNVLIVILHSFFKVEIISKVIKYVTLPTTLFCMIMFKDMTLTLFGANIYTSAFSFESVRVILLSLQLVVVFGYSLAIFLQTPYKLTWKDVVYMILSVAGMMICVMPAYMLKALFGYFPSYMLIKKFSLYHRLFMYVGIIVPIVLYFIFRKKSKEVIKFALTYLAIGALIVFSLHRKYDSFLNITSWPLHLCNTAMYILVICLVFKTEKLFYFTYFINVLGAFLAMAIPNYSDTYNIFSPGLIVFWVNHWIAFFGPLLVVALGVYQRPKLKQFIYSTVGFTVYFVLILFINAWFSNYGEVDFFFVNSDFIAEKLGTWAEHLRDVQWKFSIPTASRELKFVLYPLYQFLFWLVYVAASLGIWFIYEAGYEMSRQYADMQLKKKIEIQQKMDLIQILGGRSEEEPMDEKNVDKLILKNFSKKYGSSDVFAVKDANLEVHAGEVFGFLGPNGAGKSTIIKSVVGIQPITSGQILACGYDVEKQSVKAKQQIGFVPDHYALYEKLTGREYVNYIADLYDVSKEDRTARIDKYVKLFELEGAFDNQIKTYSHGMKQKITIMSALVHNPKIWILDEPLTGLDPQSIFQVKECMKQHAKEGNIVFFSSHIIDVVEKICDRIAIIKKGNILCTRSVKEVEEQEGGLEKFYLDNIKD